MGKKLRKKCSGVLIGCLVIALCVSFLSVKELRAYADGQTYITAIALCRGDEAVKELEEAGYKAVEQSLNPVEDGSALLFMGYTFGSKGDALRDLMVSGKSKTSIKVNELTYYQLSEVNLNEGAGGSALYLYGCYDEEAGEPIRGLSFHVVSSTDGFSNDQSLLECDGSEIVLKADSDSSPADFDEGISGSELYLKMYKGEMYRPYVSDAMLVTAKSEDVAIEKLISQKCQYYVNLNLGGDDSVSYIGYTRTSDKKAAMRSFVALETDEEEFTIKGASYEMIEGGAVKGEDSYCFYKSYDENAGNPIMDLVICTYDPDDIDGEAKDPETEDSEDDEGTTEITEDLNETLPQETPEESKKEETNKEETDSETSTSDGAKLDSDSDGEDAVPLADETTDEVPAPADTEKTEEEGTDEETNLPDDVSLAAGLRVFQTISKGEWVSQYFTRGASAAVQFLNEESAYGSAMNSNDTLWLSNIYASTADGEQFVNGIGFVAEKGSAKADPFADNYDIGAGSDSSSSVFPPGGFNSAIVIIILVIASGVASGVLIAKKSSKKDK